MKQIGIWRIAENGPTRLDSSNVRLEEDLEGWIHNDPSLLQAGLTVLGRQLDMGAVGRLDLLAIDQQGQWVVVELKRGMLYRDTIAQAIDYASHIATMPFSQLLELLRAKSPQIDLRSLLDSRQAQEEESSSSRGVRVIVVGTGQAPGLQRMIDFLSAGRIPIEVVLYQVFQLADGDRILVREIVEQQVETEEDTRYRTRSVEALADLARLNGVGDDFERVLDLGRRHGLYLHPWKHCVMLAPQGNKSRSLLTVWALRYQADQVFVYVAPEAFAEFFDVPEEQARQIIQFEKWLNLTSDQVTQLIANVDRFFQATEQPSGGETA